MLATQTMMTAGMSPPDVLNFVAEQRRGRYDLLREHFESDDPFGASSSTPETVLASAPTRRAPPQQTQSLDVVLRDESLWTDQAFETLPLTAWRISVTAIVRAGVSMPIDDDLALLEHDVLTFTGSTIDVEHAKQALNGEV